VQDVTIEIKMVNKHDISSKCVVMCPHPTVTSRECDDREWRTLDIGSMVVAIVGTREKRGRVNWSLAVPDRHQPWVHLEFKPNDGGKHAPEAGDEVFGVVRLLFG
jgi:exosome complex RNA-binding protein Rrp4